MKWYAISGSWRKTNSKVKKDVENIVSKIISKGDGIVTGGALGVDYYSTQVVLNMKRVKKQIKIFLPIKLSNFCIHYSERAKDGVITREQADMIISQLKEVHKINPKAIIDNTEFNEANTEGYYARNTKIIENCDALYAFHVNESKGTQDTINKARRMCKQVFVRKYRID